MTPSPQELESGRSSAGSGPEPAREAERERRLVELLEAADSLPPEAVLAKATLHHAALAIARSIDELPPRPDAHAVESLRAKHESLARRPSPSAKRWRLASVGLLAFLLLGVGAWKLGVRLFAPRNLLDGVAWTASSEALKCNPAMHNCGGTRTDIFFHTNAESNPWLRYDLGAPKTFSRVTVRNRQDMGLDRCLPLIVETSDDGEAWTERTRRTERFVEWTGSFPAVTARFLRLRVAAPLTWFHLEAVELHP
jgi:hypothetical protein